MSMSGALEGSPNRVGMKGTGNIPFRKGLISLRLLCGARPIPRYAGVRCSLSGHSLALGFTQMHDFKRAARVPRVSGQG